MHNFIFFMYTIVHTCVSGANAARDMLVEF